MAFSEVDEIIFRIVGTESKTLDGLNIPESSGTCSSILLSENENVHDESQPSTSQQLIERSPSPLSKSQTKLKKLKRSASKSSASDSNEDKKQSRLHQLKEEWLDLQCQVTRKDLQLKDKDLHLRDLQIMKLERELNIRSEAIDGNEMDEMDENELDEVVVPFSRY